VWRCRIVVGRVRLGDAVDIGHTASVYRVQAYGVAVITRLQAAEWTSTIVSDVGKPL
jgi:hypothetical protein